MRLIPTLLKDFIWHNNLLGQILEQSAILEGQTKMALNGMRADYTQQRDLLLTSINALM